MRSLLPRTHNASGGKVIGAGVHIYICNIYLWTKKYLNRTLAIDSPFSKICSRTSRRTYRLALPLHTPKMLSSLSKSIIPYLMRMLLY